MPSAGVDPDVELAVRAIQDKKGEEIRVLDLVGLTSITDYFVICSGRSPRQNQTIAEAVVEALRARRRKPLSYEGKQAGRWILIDYVSMVVNVFLPEVRDFYGLERLWADAELVEVGGPTRRRRSAGDVATRRRTRDHG